MVLDYVMQSDTGRFNPDQACVVVVVVIVVVLVLVLLVQQ